ncbi:M42 family metallopeptidase [Alienimonas californiensis]|uniref:Aminopeptidase YsdC n=1 Tax=Alienimonas californiensis TaxID=2527989 RepID=A0A517PAE1_9PLAN|nr:M42 family metallopeptidase [Alienimonas californiensis]QDT16339.1 Putative aminopeptidase YsdC [Alienimonas californiensis]
MNDDARAFLDRLLTTPGTSGYEERVQAVVAEYAAGWGKVSTDWHGNLTAAVNAGKDGLGTDKLRVMLAGHCDQIGLVVQHIDNDGFLRVSAVGGWDVQTLIGQAVEVHGAHETVAGVIARKAIHLLGAEERKQVPEVKDLWVDLGVEGKAEALELVAVGDPITLRPGYRALRGGLLAGPAMDDRVGVWVVFEAARRAAARQSSKNGAQAAIFAVSTVQEEIGLRGAHTAAHRIDPHVGIAVDVTHASDCPTVEKGEVGDVRIGRGPVAFRGPNINTPLFRSLTKLGKEHDLPVQVSALSRGASNDGNAIQLTRNGPATGIVGIPLRYMHSPVEVISMDDLDAAADLLCEFCLSLSADSDFTPGVDRL